MEQAIIWPQGEPILPEHLPNTLRFETLRETTFSSRLSLEKAVQEFECEMIMDALRRTDYVQTHASAMLSISRRMLKYRMDMLGITRELSGTGGTDIPAEPVP